MLRVSPFTYFVEAILGVAVAQAPAVCADSELVRVIPPTGTCGDFLGPYQSFAGGTIVNPQSTSECQFCSIANTDVFLAQVGISFDNRWRDIGIIWAYIIFNVFAAIFLYWLARVVSNYPYLIGLITNFFSPRSPGRSQALRLRRRRSSRSRVRRRRFSDALI